MTDERVVDVRESNVWLRPDPVRIEKIKTQLGSSCGQSGLGWCSGSERGRTANESAGESTVSTRDDPIKASHSPKNKRYLEVQERYRKAFEDNLRRNEVLASGDGEKVPIKEEQDLRPCQKAPTRHNP